MSDDPEKPQTPKGKRIGLFLPVPWDEDGRLISSVDPEAPPPEDEPSRDNILTPPGEIWTEGKDTPPSDDA
jgi:hypothetical protein